MSATYSLAEVAEMVGADVELKDPKRWLTKEIKSGRVTARKIGRSWRMTRADVDAALEVWASAGERRRVDVPRIGISAASAKRRLAS